jgi:hypothetical protein
MSQLLALVPSYSFELDLIFLSLKYSSSKLYPARGSVPKTTPQNSQHKKREKTIKKLMFGI